MAHGKRLHRLDLALQALRAFPVGLVDDKNIGNLHDSGLERLHVIAHAGNQDHDGHIGQAHDVHLILADADGLDQHQVAPAGIEHRGHVGRGAGEPAERPARGHAADERA